MRSNLTRRVIGTSATSIASSERLVPRGIELLASSTASTTSDVFPATYWQPETQLTPSWLPAALRRIVDLSYRPEGWDSYDAAALKPHAITGAIELFAEYGLRIQTDPAISLTPDGGLLLEWENDEASLEYSVSSSGSGSVYYSDNSGREWDGPVNDCTLLEKWLWRASGRLEP
jgi:hypothetical protein